MHLLLVLMMLMALVLVVRPQVAWTLRAWQYRDPEANYPSDLWFSLHRAGAVALIVFCLVLWAQWWQPALSTSEQAEASATEEPSAEPSPEEHILTTMSTIEGRIHDYAPTDTGLVDYIEAGRCTADPTVRVSEEGDTVSLWVRISQHDRWCGQEPDDFLEHTVDLEQALGERRVVDTAGSGVHLCRDGC
ncbi:DUF6199 family natural product biosynthesis protein [Nocardiopsis synnemataformans]|uniref:DUF6199 family natural product biosynthesis protein n=1 Tax=Nocardiopsis synnemataformans TaxID=61305 RepID=UPI003EBE97E7